MATSIFSDKSRPPTEADLAEALGPAYVLLKQILQELGDRYPPLTQEWKFYSQKSGWTLVLKQKKRTILYCSPNAAFFKVTFVYGNKAVEAARQADLPAAIQQAIEDARPYVEGRSFQVEVKNGADAAVVHQLADIKMAK